MVEIGDFYFYLQNAINMTNIHFGNTVRETFWSIQGRGAIRKFEFVSPAIRTQGLVHGLDSLATLALAWEIRAGLHPDLILARLAYAAIFKGFLKLLNNRRLKVTTMVECPHLKSYATE